MTYRPQKCYMLLYADVTLSVLYLHIFLIIKRKYMIKHDTHKMLKKKQQHILSCQTIKLKITKLNLKQLLDYTFYT